MSVFTELKRRNVIRVGLLYLVASWPVIQVSSTVASILELPNWTGRLILMLLAIGFPIALLLSWIFELTPDGLKFEKDIPKDAPRSYGTARKLDIAVAALLVISIAALALDRLIPQQNQVQDTESVLTGIPHNSIAVLPFVNMSPDPDNAYFSDGLSEEFLNLLAQIPELQVAARTSAFAFRDSDASIGEIAENLNVAHVLEGSVRKSGLRIRITAQLIKASDGYHLWSQTWDRDLDDIFAIQDEVAATVVDKLSLELLGDIPRTYQTDVEAFDLELKARAAASDFTREGLEKAQALYTQSLAIDPNNANAWYGLSIVYSNMVSRDFMTPADGFSNAQAAARRALTIDPNHAESLSSLGWIAMYWDRDMDEAARLMKQAMQISPRNPRVLNAYATLQSAYGHVDQTIRYYQDALSSDPMSVPVLTNLAMQLMDAGRFNEARELVDRIRAVNPTSFMLDRSVAWLKLSEGNFAEAIDDFTQIPGLMGAWGLALSYNGLGEFEESDQALQGLGSDSSTLVARASVYANRGDNDSAFSLLDLAMQSEIDAIMEIRMYPAFQPIHDDPRWTAMLRQLGLSDDDASRLGL